MNEKNTHISVVSPVYGAEKIVSELVKQLHEQLSSITDNYEIILVNDASPDNSWLAISDECKKDKRIKGINLSRNFGQHKAISAGLIYSKGNWIVVMDCDLQDRPDEIPNLYKKAQEGYYIVYARREERQDRYLKRLSSKVFNWLFGYLSGQQADSSIGNFGIYHSKVIQKYNLISENTKALGPLIDFLGFDRTAINVRHAERFEGKSTYSLRKLLNLAIDVALSHSNKPLKIMLKIGFIISLASFLLAIYNLIAHMLGIIQVAGFTTTVFSIWFIGGLIILILGVIGLYIGKIYDEVKGRPFFVVQDELNIENE